MHSGSQVRGGGQVWEIPGSYDRPPDDPLTNAIQPGDGRNSDPSLAASLLSSLEWLRIALEDDWAEDEDSLPGQVILGVIRQCSALMSLTIVGGDTSRVCDVMQEACTSGSIMIAFNRM
jgi:hypothetical protein